MSGKWTTEGNNMMKVHKEDSPSVPQKEIDGCTCIGSIKAPSFLIQSEYMEDEIFENYDDNDEPFTNWKSLIIHLKDRYNSGEVYELSACY